MYNPEAPFGLEPFGPELKAEGLMAERKRLGHVLTGQRFRGISTSNPER